MFSQLCKLCHSSVDLTVVNLRRYRVSSILLQEHAQFDDIEPEIQEQPRAHEEKKVPEEKKRVPIIVAKRPEFNFFSGKVFSKFESIPLASQGWFHKQSFGDHFTIMPYSAIECQDDYDDGPPAGFEQFNTHPKFIENLSKINICVPSEIQTSAIPSILKGQHNILSAETGCGKTLAYLLPMLNQILQWKKLPEIKNRRLNSPLGLIVTPSRELAEQIGREALKLTPDLGISIKVLTGGRTKKIMRNPPVKDIDLLVGSFGVVSKLTGAKLYKLNYMRHLVLDEAHALFDETFEDKLEIFFKRIAFTDNTDSEQFVFPHGAQLTLLSATMPSEMPEFLQKFVDVKSIVPIKTNSVHHVTVPQKFLRISALDKPITLLRLVKRRAMKKHPFIVFSNTSSTSDWISLYLNEFGVRTIHLNGQMPMIHRKDKFAAFQRGEYPVLSTTNAGARGLNTVHVQDVINYDFPMETADYIHRCGRTGRLGTTGECRVTNLISRRLEITLTQKIERAARRLRALPIFNMQEEDAKAREKESEDMFKKKKNRRPKSEAKENRKKKEKKSVKNVAA